MEITWLGQACFKIKGKNASVVVDPFDPDFTGLKLPKNLDADVVLISHSHKDHSFAQGVLGNPLVISGPGEYEIKRVAITGVSVFHDINLGSERGKNTVYNLNIDGVSIVHLGDLGHVLTEDQVQEIGQCDILLVPVGGVYTIDAKTAVEVVSQLEPKIVIPMHYGNIPGLKFPLEGVEAFLKESGVENITSQPKFVVGKEKLPDEMQTVLLSKS